MSIKSSNCAVCAFCQFAERDGIKWQTGCTVGQLDKYQALKGRVDPKGDEMENAIFKYTEQGDLKAYIMNSPCTFQRSKQWLDEQMAMWTKDNPPPPGSIQFLHKATLREYVFSQIPFDYTLVVISNGNVKQTIRTCKSVCNGTITPARTEIVYPYKLLNDKSKEELFGILKDKLSQGDIKPQHPWWGFNIRQVVNSAMDNPRDMVMDAIQQNGRFWIVVLQAGEKLEEGFMESIKRQVISELVDIHYIGLAPDSAILVHPILTGDAMFAKYAAFKYKNGNLVQEYQPDWVNNFYITE